MFRQVAALFFYFCVLAMSSLPSGFAQVATAGEWRRAKPSGGASDADPFDLVTGIYHREYPDLYVKDSIPLNFVRTQRNLDDRSRAFGVGASTSYDMFIVGDSQRFSWVALVNAEGSQTRYLRVTPGTGYTDAVFRNTTAPSEFLGSIIFWEHGSWTVRLLNGREYTVQACSARSKPGQCAVTEIRSMAKRSQSNATPKAISSGSPLRISITFR